MPLLIENCPTPETVCCDKAFNTASNLLEVAHTAVVACYPTDGCPRELVGYVTMGARVQDPASDYVAVSLLSIAPQTTGQPASRQTIGLPFRATYQISLLETGWPMPESFGEGITVPVADDYTNAAMLSYAHGEAMYRALRVAMGQGELNDCGDCFQQLTSLVPTPPSGGSTGWTTTYVCDFDMGRA